MELDGAHAAVMTFARIASDFGVEFAPLALKNMMNSGGAITSCLVESDRGPLGTAASTLNGGGTLLNGFMTESFTDLVAEEMTVDLDDDWW